MEALGTPQEIGDDGEDDAIRRLGLAACEGPLEHLDGALAAETSLRLPFLVIARPCGFKKPPGRPLRIASRFVDECRAEQRAGQAWKPRALENITVDNRAHRFACTHGRLPKGFGAVTAVLTAL